MDFIKNILWYYGRESQQGFFSSTFGVLLLIAAVLLFKFANPLSILKGFTLPFLLIGLLMGLGGFADGYSSQKAGPEKIRLFKENPREFFKQEVVKVEATHRSWKGVRIFWSIITLAGAGLLFFVKKDYWVGVAIGTLILSAAGHIEEAISKKFNDRYYQQVLDASKEESNVSFNSMPQHNRSAPSENKTYTAMNLKKK